MALVSAVALASVDLRVSLEPACPLGNPIRHPELHSLWSIQGLSPCSVSLIYLLFDLWGVADNSEHPLFSPTQVFSFRLPFQ